MQNRINKIMDDAQLSNKEFARQIGVQPSAISHFISGRNKPSLEVVKKIMVAFPDLNPEWLLLGIEPMYRHEKAAQRDLFDADYVDTSNIAFSGNQIESKRKVLKAEVTHNQPLENILASNKRVSRVVVYYTDNTYEDFFKQ